MHLIIFSKKIKFNPSILNVEKGLIGEIIFDRMEFIKKTIEKGVFEIISIGEHSVDIRRLSNGNFISSNWKSVTLLDENFKQLKKIEMTSYGCAIHNDKGIYIIDDKNHCIYLMDNELNIIKTFGSDLNELCNPESIFCQNDYLFVSDSGNERIQILTLNLNYYDTIQLDFNPLSIAISSTIIGINGSNDKIHFYDLKTKTLKKEYQNIFGRISFIDSHFYVVTYNPPEKLFIFDQEGELVDELSLESMSEHIQDYQDGLMYLTKDYLFVSATRGRNVLKFKL